MIPSSCVPVIYSAGWTCEHGKALVFGFTGFLAGPTRSATVTPAVRERFTVCDARTEDRRVAFFAETAFWNASLQECRGSQICRDACRLGAAVVLWLSCFSWSRPGHFGKSQRSGDPDWWFLRSRSPPRVFSFAPASFEVRRLRRSWFYGGCRSGGLPGGCPSHPPASRTSEMRSVVRSKYWWNTVVHAIFPTTRGLLRLFRDPRVVFSQVS